MGIGAVARLFVDTPPAKLRHVPEASALHVLVRDFDHQLGPQRLPRQILALAPAALASRHAMLRPLAAVMLRPALPRVIGQRVLAIGREEFDEFPALLLREARADTDVLQTARIVEQPEQQRTDRSALAFLVPAKSGNHAVAIALDVSPLASPACPARRCLPPVWP